MQQAVSFLIAFGKIFGALGIIFVMFWAPAAAGAPIEGLFVPVWVILNGWAIYSFLRYRETRQDELADVLATAVGAGVPLAAAVRRYLDDGSRPSRFRTVLAGFARFALPLYAYTRVWVGWRNFDRLVEELADRLESGESLSKALHSVPGASYRAFRLAAAVGEASGSLDPWLRSPRRERRNSAWLEVAPRLIYPLAVLLIVAGVTSFVMLSIIPKFKRIFDEFGEKLPPSTQNLMEIILWFNDYWFAVPLAKLLLLAAAAALIVSPEVRWHLPVFGRLYRWGVQSEVLRSLGRLLAGNCTVPLSLKFLRFSDEFPQFIEDRLDDAAVLVERGEPLDRALEEVELLSPAMAPLVRSAARAGTLPWALGELGEQLSSRAFRLVHRFSLIVAPLMVVGIAVLVAFIALGMFMPLIHLLARLSE